MTVAGPAKLVCFKIEGGDSHCLTIEVWRSVKGENRK